MGRFLRMYKGWSRDGAWAATLKEPYEMFMAWEPDRDRRSNFFSPPAHLCAVIYMYKTEVSLNAHDVKQQIHDKR